MDEAIVVDEGRIEGDAVSIQCDCGELKVQSIVMPLVITDLEEQDEGKKIAVTSSAGTNPKGSPSHRRLEALHIPASTKLRSKNNIFVQNLLGNQGGMENSTSQVNF